MIITLVLSKFNSVYLNGRDKRAHADETGYSRNGPGMEKIHKQYKIG